MLKGKQVVVNNDIVNVPCKPAEDVEINNDGKFVVSLRFVVLVGVCYIRQIVPACYNVDVE